MYKNVIQYFRARRVGCTGILPLVEEFHEWTRYVRQENFDAAGIDDVELIFDEWLGNAEFDAFAPKGWLEFLDWADRTLSEYEADPNLEYNGVVSINLNYIEDFPPCEDYWAKEYPRNWNDYAHNHVKDVVDLLWESLWEELNYRMLDFERRVDRIWDRIWGSIPY